MKVLGIDPGTLNLGWGFIHWEGHPLEVSHGCLKAPQSSSFFERLHRLSVGLEKLIAELQPDVVAIEKIFLGKNVDSAFKLGHIRGICAAHCQAAGASVAEYAARSVKKQITGSGQADKQIVMTFVTQQLNLKQRPQTLDASDALALAFCHILQDSVNLKHKRGLGIR